MKTQIIMRNAVLLVCGVFALSACDTAKKELGLTRNAPDEFTVLKRAPLEMPPDYYLRPPEPGAPRPQEEAEFERSRDYVFGETQTETAPAPVTSSADSILLDRAGANLAQDDIRRIVDTETATMEPADKSVTDKLFRRGDDKPAASVVDSKAEAERIRENKAAGRAVSEGQTPIINDD